ncbi:MAG: hypothetical protein A2W44_04705 [Acinetobacter sp. RIFCSPHIGHO2_12_41_5]|nr:MAG: hypothetical protein A2W44_04705 [Acinetobacter sp. RIFCSPHIGHO2_12_41_5]
MLINNIKITNLPRDGNCLRFSKKLNEAEVEYYTKILRTDAESVKERYGFKEYQIFNVFIDSGSMMDDDKDPRFTHILGWHLPDTAAPVSAESGKKEL